MNRQQQLCIALNNQQTPSLATFLKHFQNNPRCYSCVYVAGLQVRILKETNKQKNPHANFSTFGTGSTAELSSLLRRCLSHSAEEFLTCHAAPCTDRRGRQQHRPFQQFYFPHLFLPRTLQNVCCICCECLTGGISHSPLSLVSAVG